MKNSNLRNTLLLVALVGALTLSVAYGAKRADAFTCDGEAISVVSGDTLWALAEAKCDGNIQVVTDNLVKTYGATIQAGDIIWLPTSNDCRLENRGGEVYDECG